MISLMELKIGESFCFLGESARNNIWDRAYQFSESHSNFEFRMKVICGKIPLRLFKIWRIKKTKKEMLNPIRRRIIDSLLK